jgi:hypothetical protein
VVVENGKLEFSFGEERDLRHKSQEQLRARASLRATLIHVQARHSGGEIYSTRRQVSSTGHTAIRLGRLLL